MSDWNPFTVIPTWTTIIIVHCKPTCSSCLFLHAGIVCNNWIMTACMRLDHYRLLGWINNSPGPSRLFRSGCGCCRSADVGLNSRRSVGVVQEEQEEEELRGRDHVHFSHSHSPQSHQFLPAFIRFFSHSKYLKNESVSDTSLLYIHYYRLLPRDHWQDCQHAAGSRCEQL